tara:strand:+ start:1019 stop:1417 length:399 start_codon:yes stop_codon:yes gene_type:complete
MPIGLDASLPLQKNNEASFYKLNKTIRENIKQKVKMLFLTAPGERIMVPHYGIGLSSYLFENDPEVEIIEQVQEQVSLYLKDISIVSLEVKKGDMKSFSRSGQKNTLSVNFTYLITGVDLVDSLTLVETQKL